MRRPLNTALWILFALFVVYGTTIPFNFSSTPGWAAQKLAHVPLNPFIAADTGRRISTPDFVQNVLLFLPFSVLGALRLRSPSRSRLTTIVVVTGIGAALSLGIEALQLLTVDRTSSVSDIVANTFGALVGVIGAQLGENVSDRALRTLSLTGVFEQPSSYGALVAVIVRSRTHATLVSIALTLAIAVPVEYAQGWFVGRYPDVTDAALSVVAAIFGLLAGRYGASLFAARTPAVRVASTP